MKLIDVASVGFSLTREEILVSDKSVVTNPKAFLDFIAGLQLDSSALFDARIASVINSEGWTLGGGLVFCQQFFHFILPKFYSVKHLSALGGRFVLRITGVADYTICLFLGRVLVLNGALLEAASGRAIIHAEIRSDAFTALCNNLLADLCKATLTNLEPKAA